jgi:hypothetical protein
MAGEAVPTGTPFGRRRPGQRPGTKPNQNDDLGGRVTETRTINPGDAETAHRVLGLEMCENDAKASTVRHYLIALLAKVWEYAEDFSGKRPFGNSSWRYDLYEPLGKAGLIQVTLDEDGYIDHFPDSERRRADRLIAAAIRAMGATAQNDDDEECR